MTIKKKKKKHQNIIIGNGYFFFFFGCLVIESNKFQCDSYVQKYTCQRNVFSCCCCSCSCFISINVDNLMFWLCDCNLEIFMHQYLLMENLVFLFSLFPRIILAGFKLFRWYETGNKSSDRQTSVILFIPDIFYTRMVLFLCLKWSKFFEKKETKIPVHHIKSLSTNIATMVTVKMCVARYFFSFATSKISHHREKSNK